jgi:hypothetical protein
MRLRSPNSGRATVIDSAAVPTSIDPGNTTATPVPVDWLQSTTAFGGAAGSVTGVEPSGPTHWVMYCCRISLSRSSVICPMSKSSSGLAAAWVPLPTPNSPTPSKTVAAMAPAAVLVRRIPRGLLLSCRSSRARRRLLPITGSYSSILLGVEELIARGKTLVTQRTKQT